MVDVKARVLFVANTAEFGGLERHLLELACRLDDTGCECTILAYGPDFYTERLGQHRGIQVVAIARRGHDSLLGYLGRFRKLRPTVVVFEKGNLTAFPLVGYLAARLSGARATIVIEQLIAEALPSPVTITTPWDYVRRAAGFRTRTRWKTQLAASLIDRIICVGKSVEQRLVDEYGLPARRTLTIPNGVNLTRFQSGSKPDSPAGTLTGRGTRHQATIVCVSRLVPRKRLDDVLDAFRLIRAAHPDCRLLIVGEGPEKDRLYAKAAELGCTQRVRFEGYAEDVRPYLASGDIFVTASENEGLPFSLVEAMASGLPCIATDIPGHRDVITHGENGLIVPLKSPTELAAAIEHLLTHEEERDRLARTGRETVERFFNTDTNMARITSEILRGATES